MKEMKEDHKDYLLKIREKRLKSNLEELHNSIEISFENKINEDPILSAFVSSSEKRTIEELEKNDDFKKIMSIYNECCDEAFSKMAEEDNKEYMEYLSKKEQ